MSSTNDPQIQGNIVPAARATRPVDPGVTIGHVHLRTADIDRVRAFYVGVLGFEVIAEARDVPGWGTTGDVLFLSAGGYHHHLGFNTWQSGGGPPPPDCATRTGRCARSPTTAPTWRSTSPIPTATTSSWRGTGRSTSGRVTTPAT